MSRDDRGLIIVVIVAETTAKLLNEAKEAGDF
jgi:hypothetical protein